MTGTLAQTIQGEAGSDPAAQFAVASTIWNRSKAGGFPGGTDPSAIVNAPQQYVGYAATPNASAQALAAAIQNGTLPNYGTTGNATYFQSYQPGFTPATAGGVNIGGNYFSDQFGNPSANFVPPSLGTSQIAAGEPNNASSGIAAGSGAGSAAGIDTSSGGIPVGDSMGGAVSSSTGAPVNLGIQQPVVTQITTWLNGIASGVAKGIGAYLGDIQNWFVRAFVIILGLVVLAIGLIKLSGHSVTEVVAKGAELVAA